MAYKEGLLLAYAYTASEIVDEFVADVQVH